MQNKACDNIQSHEQPSKMDIHTCPHQQLQLDRLVSSYALQISVQRRYKDKQLQVDHLNWRSRADFL